MGIWEFITRESTAGFILCLAKLSLRCTVCFVGLGENDRENRLLFLHVQAHKITPFSSRRALTPHLHALAQSRVWKVHELEVYRDGQCRPDLRL